MADRVSELLNGVFYQAVLGAYVQEIDVDRRKIRLNLLGNIRWSLSPAFPFQTVNGICGLDFFAVYHFLYRRGDLVINFV